jgi:hypothetical protein
MIVRALSATALIIALFICPFALSQFSLAAQPYTDHEAYAVYSALLESVLTEKPGTPVIRVETESFANCIDSPNPQPDFAEALSAYTELTTKHWLLEREFQLSRPYEMMRQEEIKTMFESPGDGWKRFYETFPGSPGIFQFSAVGFNADKTVAIVYMGKQCHWLCGGGTQHVLQKKDGKWQRVATKGGGGGCSWAS